MGIVAEFWQNLKQFLGFTRRRCTWDGKIIEGAGHVYFGNIYCNRHCAVWETKAQLAERARQEGV